MANDPKVRLLKVLEESRRAVTPALSRELVEELAAIEMRNQFTHDRKGAKADLTAAVEIARRSASVGD
jgi:hypothetical protein